MSFFILSTAEDKGEEIEKFSKSARLQGFKDQKKILLGENKLYLYGDLSGGRIHQYSNDSGDFAILLGTMIYEEAALDLALPKLLQDFHLDDFRWQNLIGSFICLLYKDKQLVIFGDGLGACKLYCETGRRLWSNSFFAMCEILRPKQLNRQACYEYVINGSIFGQKTLAEDIVSLPANSLLHVSEVVSEIKKPSPISNTQLEASSLEQYASLLNSQLDKVFQPIAAAFRDGLRVSFSGGFDSRLMLAMLLKHGAKPSLFVYGSKDCLDVQIAKNICNKEGLDLEWIDKSSTKNFSPREVSQNVERDMFWFDGWKLEHGLLDFGVDGDDRRRRHQSGQIPLNGSLGEIYRNFHYIPDVPRSTEDVISTFYSRYDKRSFTNAFDEGEYREELKLAMNISIGATSNKLERYQVEQLYPNFRGRFWTGRDAQINQRFGPMFFPYLECQAISHTAKVPMKYKDMGYLQGKMIALTHDRLANYPSDYGFPLAGKRPVSYKLKSFISTHRSPSVRKWAFRLQHRTKQVFPRSLRDCYLEPVVNLDFPVMAKLFNIDRVYSAQQYGLIATLEIFAERYGMKI